MNVTVRSFTTGLSFRPLVQKKLEVLSKAGLSKEDFSAADTKTMKVSCSLCNNATCKWWCWLSKLYMILIHVLHHLSGAKCQDIYERNLPVCIAIIHNHTYLCIKKRHVLWAENPCLHLTHLYIGSNMTTLKMIIYSLKIGNVIHSQYSLKTNSMPCFYSLLINHTKAEYIQLHYCNRN